MSNEGKVCRSESSIIAFENGRPSLALLGEVSAGFPMIAQDYTEQSIDLNKSLIRHPASTFFVRVRGDSMKGAGINDGALLIVDRSLNPASGDIVIAAVDGQLVLKKLRLHGSKARLEAANSNYKDIELGEFNELRIWGVVCHAIHTLR